MRTNLATFLRRLALCSITAISSVLGPAAQAHDLPNFIPYHELGADCLGVRAPRVAKPTPARPAPPAATPQTCPLKATAAQVQQLFSNMDAPVTFTRTSERLQAARQQLASGIAACWIAMNSTSLVAALPEDAAPPVPSLRPRDVYLSQGNAPALGNRNFVEDYLPYDLCIRDWRFGRYSYRGLSRTAHLPTPAAEVASASQLARAYATPATPTLDSRKHAEVLAGFLRRVEAAQCQMIGELGSLDSAFAVGRQLARTTIAVPRATAKLLAMATPPIATPAPFYTEPQFVVYEVGGKHFLVLAEQARAWQAVRNRQEKLASDIQPASVPEPRLRPAMDAAEAEAELLGFASRQLANFGQQCLQLSSLLDSLHHDRIAARDQPAVR